MTQQGAIQTIKEYITKTWGSWEPNWQGQEKYYIFFTRNGILQYEFWHSTTKQYSPIGYLDSVEKMEELKIRFPEELKRIYQ